MHKGEKLKESGVKNSLLVGQLYDSIAHDNLARAYTSQFVSPRALSNAINLSFGLAYTAFK